MNYCPECGEGIPANAAFCGNCGAHIVEGTPGAQYSVKGAAARWTILDRSGDVFRLVMAVAVLVAGLSLSYYYVLYLPQRDQQERAERQHKEAEAKQREELARQANEKAQGSRRQAYLACTSTAQVDYNLRWDSACKRNYDTAVQGRENCEAGGTVDAAYCASLWKIPPAANCSLPTSLANSYGEDFRQAKQLCLEEAKSGVSQAVAEPGNTVE